MYKHIMYLTYVFNLQEVGFIIIRLLRWLTGKQPASKQERQVPYLDWEDALEKEMTTTPVFFPGKSHGQRSMVGSVHRIAKSWK